MTDKNYCASSFLAFRYIYESDKDFADNLKHRIYRQHDDSLKTLVKTAKDVDSALEKVFQSIKNKKLGILLSGGMDSAILASYMSGCDAYTFRFMNGLFQQDELKRAEYYAKKYNLNLHYVDISWDVVEKNVDLVMKCKNAPVHSIEPQIYEGALIAKKDGVEIMVIGDAADYVFYGMDGLLSRDWLFDDFYKRMIYVEPADILVNPVDLHYIFEKYRKGIYIDFLGMYNTIIVDESYASYENAFFAADMQYIDPYELLKMADPVDLNRVRNGESKYLVRELFRMKYPEMPVPQKNPMPRPVDEYFKNWTGPTRNEFKKNLDINKYTGNQKWLIWSLERFLNISGIDDINNSKSNLETIENA